MVFWYFQEVEKGCIGNLNGLMKERISTKCVINYKRAGSLREKCPNTEFFMVPIFLYLVRIQENTDQKKLRI